MKKPPKMPAIKTPAPRLSMKAATKIRAKANKMMGC
jgi:hypothetical protein